MSQKKSKCSCEMKLKDGSFGFHADNPDCPIHGTKAPKDCPDCGQPENMHDAECKSNGVLALLKSKQPSKAPLRELLEALEKSQEQTKRALELVDEFENLVPADLETLQNDPKAQKFLKAFADSQVREAELKVLWSVLEEGRNLSEDERDKNTGYLVRKKIKELEESR